MKIEKIWLLGSGQVSAYPILVRKNEPIRNVAVIYQVMYYLKTAKSRRAGRGRSSVASSIPSKLDGTIPPPHPCQEHPNP